MTVLDRLIDSLEGKREGSSWRCLCPVHNGHCLIVTERDGKPLVHCKSGCEQSQVIGELERRGLWLNGAKDGAEPPISTNPLAEYVYIAQDGATVAVKGRFRKPDGGKRFLWKLAGAETWNGLAGLKEKDLPLYNEHLLPTEHGPVLMVEGEKAAIACLDASLLAVCPPGGASTKDFGRQLDLLAGRDVILWADNDGEGRALMRRIAQQLDGVAAVVRWFTPDLPPKGDAYDYFAGGGTRDQIMQELASRLTSPRVEETPTGYVVSIPETGGLVHFRFDDVEQGTHRLDADLTVWQEIPGTTREPFSGRLNVVSLSQRETFRRQLDEMLGKGTWTALLNRACQMVRQAVSEADRSVRLLNAPIGMTMPALLPPWLVAGPSIIFGKGGAAKTFLALAMGLAVGMGWEFLGRHTVRANVLYIDYEADATTLQERLRLLLHGRGEDPDDVPLDYWPARGIPLAEMLPALQRKVRASDIGFIIVDSAALAAGGEPERAETAIRYFNALAQLQVPSLSVAHVTKGDEDQWPFGSIFYHNSARSTWNVKLLQEQEEGIAHVGLFHRKANSSRLEAPIGLRLEFSDDAVTILREEIMPEWSGEISLSRRIEKALAGGAQSVKQLAGALASNPDTVRRTLNRKGSVVMGLGDSPDGSQLWGLKGEA